MRLYMTVLRLPFTAADGSAGAAGGLPVGGVAGYKYRDFPDGAVLARNCLDRMSQTSAAQDDADRVPLRQQATVYGVATFTNSAPDVVLVVVPLWVLTLDPSPLLIGVVLGMRHVGPMLFSIHGGALMDKLGTRNVVIALALLAILVPLAFPFSPWIPALILLQFLGGLADTLGWVGAQTLSGQVLYGNPVYTGRLAFCTRIGTFIGPPAAGAAWDFFGPWGGFIALAIWGIGTLVSILALPKEALPAQDEPRPRFTPGILLPRLGDYVAAIKLFAIPVMALVLGLTALRQFGAGVQSSFYVVYLEGIGISGTAIGILISINGIAGAAVSLGTGRLARAFQEFRLLIFMVAASLIAIGITPMMTHIVPLGVASAVRGAALAISVVLIVSLIARSVGPANQGKGMGLRVTCNQTLSVLAPIAMGAITEVAGIEMSFYVVTGAAMLLLAALAVMSRRLEPPPLLTRKG
jgi:MFS family permease